MSDRALALDAAGMTKTFEGTVALEDVELKVAAGEIHGLVGQNGAGKSSLIKVLSGYHAPDSGTLRMWGVPVDLPVREPHRIGIAVIHQDLGLVSDMTALENFRVGHESDRAPLRRISWRHERQEFRRFCHEFELDIDPDVPAGSLSAADRSTLAIARATKQLSDAGGNQLLILDEPTAYLETAQVSRVTQLMRSLAARGSSVLFVSHRIAEVLGVCERVTVLRDGRSVSTVDSKDLRPAELLRLMLGREIGTFYPEREERGAGDVALTVRSVAGERVTDISFDLARGEILGITGRAGMGHEEVPYLLVGAREPAQGTIAVAGGEGRRDWSPGSALEAGMVLAPADRQTAGGWLDATAAENVSLPVLRRHVRRGRLDHRGIRAIVESWIERLGVQPPSSRRPLRTFSGGNQQKLLLAKWLQASPQVVLLHEPTAGVDAGAKREIFALVRDIASAGAAVMIVSNEYDQLAAMCDRVLIVRGGRVATELGGADLTEQGLVEACYA